MSSEIGVTPKLTDRICEFLSQPDLGLDFEVPDVLDMAYGAASKVTQQLMIEDLARSEAIPHARSAVLILELGGMKDLSRFCDIAEGERGDRDFLLFAIQVTAGAVQRGICEDPSPLIREIIDLNAACDEPWSEAVYRIIIDRHPRAVDILWCRFIAISNDVGESEDFLTKRELGDQHFASICESHPYQILAALHDGGYFGNPRDLLISDWFGELIRTGSGAAVEMVFEVVSELDKAKSALCELCLYRAEQLEAIADLANDADSARRRQVSQAIERLTSLVDEPTFSAYCQAHGIGLSDAVLHALSHFWHEEGCSPR